MKGSVSVKSIWSRTGVSTHFYLGYISLLVAFKGPNVILGLYKCKYFLTRVKELGALPGRNKVPGWIK